MSLKVIGAGLGRTGTNSFRLAMNMLGFDKCHHMFEVRENPDQAHVFLAASRGEEVNWDTLFNGFQSTCDWPSCHFWRELSTHYPEAKIVLTLRDAESWYNSMNQTIFQHMREMMNGPINPIGEMVAEVVYRQAFNGNIDDKDHAIDVYERHNQSVREAIPPERLLEFKPSDGWEPLCKFLGVAVPNSPYPKTNSTEEFRKESTSLTRG